MMHDQAFQMGVAVRFSRAVVPVVLAKRGEMLQPLVDVA